MINQSPPKYATRPGSCSQTLDLQPDSLQTALCITKTKIVLIVSLIHQTLVPIPNCVSSCLTILKSWSGHALFVFTVFLEICNAWTGIIMIMGFEVSNSGLQMKGAHQKKILFLNQNICCGYSKDGSFEHLKQMFKLMDKDVLTNLALVYAQNLSGGNARKFVKTYFTDMTIGRKWLLVDATFRRVQL